MAEVQNDPDRVTPPAEAHAPTGEFERVSWDEGARRHRARLGRVSARADRRRGWYLGNPGAFSYSHPLWRKGFLDCIGSPHAYGAGSQDVNNRFAASALLYGTPLAIPIPDIERTDFLFMVGANPLVSHGSVLSAPRVRERLLNEVERAWCASTRAAPRPRASSSTSRSVPTATPGCCCRCCTRSSRRVSPTGLPRRHARGSRRAGAPRRRPPAGAHRGRHGDRAGARARAGPRLRRPPTAPRPTAARAPAWAASARWSPSCSMRSTRSPATSTGPGARCSATRRSPLDDLGEQIGLATYGEDRARFGDFPDVLGDLPASLLPLEITTPGERQIRALFVSAGNPVLSVPDGDALERALGRARPDGVARLLRERDQPPRRLRAAQHHDVRARGRSGGAAAVLRHPVRPGHRSGHPSRRARRARSGRSSSDRAADRQGPLQRAGRSGRWRRSASGSRRERLVDLLLRTGPRGDLFGLRRAGSASKLLRDHPHGLVLAEHLETGCCGRSCAPRGRRIASRPRRSWPSSAAGGGERRRPGFPLRLIGLRELRSHNSWMHNAPLLMRGERVHALRVHPDDAAAHGLEDGGQAQARVEVRRRGGAGRGHRRDDARHGRPAARLGAPRRLAARQPQRGREREPARQLRAGRPRGARRHGAPQRHPGARLPGCGRRLEEPQAAALGGAVARGVGGRDRQRGAHVAAAPFSLSALRSFEPKRRVSRPVSPAASVRGRELTRYVRAAPGSAMRAMAETAQLSPRQVTPSERPPRRASLRVLPTLGSGASRSGGAGLRTGGVPSGVQPGPIRSRTPAAAAGRRLGSAPQAARHRRSTLPSEPRSHRTRDRWGAWRP